LTIQDWLQASAKLRLPESPLLQNTAMRRSTATQGDATEHSDGPPSACAASKLEASGQNATELAVARQRAWKWRNSVECQSLIQVLLSLQIHGHSQLINVLVHRLPPCFMPSSEEAFFAALHHEAISDVDLRKSIVDFIVGWSSMHFAKYHDIIADPAVERQANAILPEYIPLWVWIKKRLHQEMELLEDSGVWFILVVQGSATEQAFYRKALLQS